MPDPEWIDRAKLEQIETLSKERLQILSDLELALDKWKAAKSELATANAFLVQTSADFDTVIAAFRAKTAEIETAIEESGVGSTNP